VKDEPAGVSEQELRRALDQGWALRLDELRYAPVGAGSYHWTARDGQGDRWFVTVDDLDDKSWLGRTRPEAFAGLRAALGTARALRDQAGLGFVVAPEPAVDGAALRPVNPRYAVAVYALVEGSSGEFGQPLAPAEQDELLDLLAALHQAAPPPSVPVAGLALAQREVLASALDELDRPWSGGPFSEPARALLASAAGPVRDLLTTFDRLRPRLTAAPHQVITHGEPHPGNLMRAGEGLRLIDWDTVGRAVPERDLWSVLAAADGPTAGGGDAARRYTEATGHPVDPDALRFYRIRWALDDIAAFTSQFRARHGHTADAEASWQALQETVADADAAAGGQPGAGAGG
jgi:spectinomycin phosphotransferase